MRVSAILVMTALLGALGGYYLFSLRADTAPRPEPRAFIWSVDMDALRAMVISLPRAGRSEAWVRHEDQYWYFDRPNGQRVDMKRWGGGVPLLVSGPGAERAIASDATSEALQRYGLLDPRMKIALTLENKDVIGIEVGDPAPDGEAYYIRLAGSRNIYTVHRSWYEVLERLVLQPPYSLTQPRAVGEGRWTVGHEPSRLAVTGAASRVAAAPAGEAST